MNNRKEPHLEVPDPPVRYPYSDLSFPLACLQKRFLRLDHVAQIRPLNTTQHSSPTTAANDLRVVFTITYRIYSWLVLVLCANIARPVEKLVGKNLSRSKKTIGSPWSLKTLLPP